MELQRSQTLADPFLAAVRRRHPDTDVVLVPAEPPPPPPPPLPPPEPGAHPGADLAAASLAAGGLADLLWGALGEPVPADVHWARGPADGTVVARSRIVRHRDDEPLAPLARALAGAGAVRRISGAVDRLVLGTPEAGATVSWARATGVLVAEVVSAPVPLPAEDARALVAARVGRRS
jgi:hypothetical protein